MLAQLESAKKYGLELSVRTGISDDEILQLTGYANSDSEVARFTSDPKRFKDQAAFQKWLSKGRQIYTLGDDYGKLLGVVWFGQEQIPVQISDAHNWNTTFAIRTYAEARGKGLATELMATTIKDYRALACAHIGIWLETSADNYPAVKTYQKVGFSQVTQPDSHNKIIMVQDK